MPDPIDSPRPSWREFLRFAVIAVGITLIPHYALLLEQVRRLKGFGNVVLLGGAAASYVLWCAAIIALGFWAKKLQGSWKALGVALPTSWREVLGIGGGCGVFSFGISHLFVLAMHGGVALARLSIVPSVLGRGVISTVLLAFWEEFLYRGVLYGLAQRFSSRRTAAILSSLIFALTHPPSVWPVVFISSLIYCHVYDHTKSICGPGLSHSIHNILIDLIKSA
ncbi:MAG: type II CAAX endopeptidase family protein [Elusimicrobiota bacterium]|jgi:membrane protease YdiL (CAAX protease family)